MIRRYSSSVESSVQAFSVVVRTFPRDPTRKSNLEV